MMNTILISSKQNKFDKAVEQFTYRHPYTAFLALSIGMPIFIIIAVWVCTTVIMLPIACTMGWL